MALTKEEYISRLLECLCRKSSHLNEMIELSKRQSVAIAADNFDILEEYLNQKQLLIEEVDKVDKEFDVYFKRFKSLTGIHSFEEAADTGVSNLPRLKEKVGEVMALLNKLREIEGENKKQMSNAFEEVKEKIKGIHAGLHANKAYTSFQSLEQKSYFIDKKK